MLTKSKAPPKVHVTLPWKPLFRDQKFVVATAVVAAILTAGVFVAHWQVGIVGPFTLVACLYAVYATVTGAIDSVVKRLPNVFTFSAAIAATLWCVVSALLQEDWSVLLRGVGGGLIVFAVWYGLALITDVGWGDVKFSYAGAALLGSAGWAPWVAGNWVWMMLLMLLSAIFALMTGKRGDDSIAQGPTIGLAVVISLAFPLMFTS